MLTEQGCKQRRKRLWESLSETIEWVLIADPRHVHYFANYWVHPLSFSTSERGLLLLERDGKATLFEDNFTGKSIKPTKPHVDRIVTEDWYDHTHSVINRDHALFAALKTVSEHLYGRPGAIEAEWLPVGAREVLSLDREHHSTSQEQPGSTDYPDLGTAIRHLRRQKHSDELELIRRCMAAGDAGHEKALNVVEPGMTELEVYQAILDAATTEAGRAIILYGDFRATNRKTPKAGGLPTDYELRQGDMMILDFSVEMDCYRSDFTNTIAVGGANDEQVMLFRLVEAAMKAGEETLKAGAAAKDVYAATAAPLRESGYADTWTSHAGHGLGLAHPEPPVIVPESADTLLAGDVVTLEPALYVEGIGGIRIENNYLITAEGYERLSNHHICLG
ncbi:MAG: aminopeptidase P family protein [Planctomycetaceae bacterium]|nr:aminopeptidase P family protein [Planctomycetaceae bacterium]